MKKIIIYSILIISISLNFYQKNQNNSLYFKYNELLKNETINKDCHIMYVNYFINPEGIEFDIPPVINCLKNKIFKQPYELNGINSKILSDLNNQKENLNNKILNQYKESLKEGFLNKINTPDKIAIYHGLEIINEKDFIKKLINESEKENKFINTIKNELLKEFDKK